MIMIMKARGNNCKARLGRLSASVAMHHDINYNVNIISINGYCLHVATGCHTMLTLVQYSRTVCTCPSWDSRDRYRGRDGVAGTKTGDHTMHASHVDDVGLAPGSGYATVML